MSATATIHRMAKKKTGPAADDGDKKPRDRNQVGFEARFHAVLKQGAKRHKQPINWYILRLVYEDLAANDPEYEPPPPPWEEE